MTAIYLTIGGAALVIVAMLGLALLMVLRGDRCDTH